MSSGALKNQPKQKSGKATALPAPPPQRSLHKLLDKYDIINDVRFQKILPGGSSPSYLFGLVTHMNPVRDTNSEPGLHVDK